MKIDRPRAAVPWVPSRYRYALFRLVAYARLARRPLPMFTPGETRVLAIDRDQSSGEAYTIAIVVWFTAAAFMAHLLSARLVTAAAVLVAVPLAAFAFNAAIVLMGIAITPLLHLIGVPRGPNNIGVNSAVILISLGLAASYFATSSGWVAVPAWIFLLCIAVNGMAAIILFTLRGRIQADEQRCVV